LVKIQSQQQIMVSFQDGECDFLRRGNQILIKALNV